MTEMPRRDAVYDVRSLLPASLQAGTRQAVGELASYLAKHERPISLVFGSREDQPRGERPQLLLLTDQAVIIAPMRRGAARRIPYAEIDSFSSRNSNPASYALDFVTLGLSKSMSCHYVFRLNDGTRIPLANVRPERRGFTVARRITWYRRKPSLPTFDSRRLASAADAASGVASGLMRRARAASKAHGLPGGDEPTDDGAPPLENDGEVSRDDILAHLATLHEAGLLTEAELLAKKAEVDSKPIG